MTVDHRPVRRRVRRRAARRARCAGAPGIHCLNRTDAYGMEQLYVDGMDELLAKDAAFFHENFAGSLTKRVLSFASQFEDFVDTLAFQIVANLLPLAFASVVLWQFDPLLVLVLLGMVTAERARGRAADPPPAGAGRRPGGVVGAAVRPRRGHAEQHGRRARLRLGAARGGRARAARPRAPQADADLVGLQQPAHRHARRPDVDRHQRRRAPARRSRWRPARAAPGVAAVIVTFAYLAQATNVLFEFNQIWRQLERSVTEAAQFTELLLDPPTVLDPDAPEERPTGPADVRLERVRFTHAGQGTPLFDGLDLHIADGERVGLVGRSGGGKTSIVRLLLRLMDVDGGRILVGGRDITRLTQADLRSLIAYVPQDPVMFHRTLRENIAFGRPGATDAQIRAAAEAAHVLEFVDGLPQGFDTLVGERGVKLSGGQRQRVAIARAVLRDAPVLLLDEATSALDSESEAHIQDALWSMMQGRTAIAVAHRLSTVAGMDRLIVLDRGRVVEEG